jgi:hypothetical protein
METITTKEKLRSHIAQRSQKWHWLGEIEQCPILTNDNYGNLIVIWTAKMAVDCDGMPENSYNDPYYQRETSLSYHGRPINADMVPYLVVPPLIRNGVQPVVMGCQGAIINMENGLSTPAVVADQGPEDKLGEASCESASRVGLDRDPNHGGTDEHIIRYMIWPGIPAMVDGIEYNLQPA